VFPVFDAEINHSLMWRWSFEYEPGEHELTKKRTSDPTITPMAVRMSAVDNLERIVATLGKPGGFAKLTLDQRKFMLGVALAAVVPADLKIKHTEVGHLQKIIKTRLHCPASMSEDILSLACSKPQSILVTETLAKALPELLGAEDLINMIGHLWELAIIDNDLHAEEEKLVYRVADIAGVPRKRVAEQLAKAATKI
jgi:uncharacterized tellurite resistance protein B-like protein